MTNESREGQPIIHNPEADRRDLLESLKREAEARDGGPSFEHSQEREKPAQETARILQFNPEKKEALTSKPKVSDEANEFLVELENAKTEKERIDVMNKVLLAAQSGVLTPNEMNILVENKDLKDNIVNE